MEPEKCLGYLRISTLGQDKGYSLEHQKAHIRQYCQAYNIQIVRFFEDRQSGRTTNDGLKALLKELYNNSQIQYLIVYRLDRLFRNLLEFIKLLQEFKVKGKKLVLVNERMIFDDNNVTSELNLKLISLMAEYEANTIKNRLKEGKESKRDAYTGDNLYLGGSVPFGKKISTVKNGSKIFKVLIPDDVEIKVIKIIGLSREASLAVVISIE